MTNVVEDEFYSIKEVAKMLKVVYLTVYRWIKSGKLTAYKAGKQYRIKNTDISKFMKLRK